jgi:phage baseplate assembly protein W
MATITTNVARTFKDLDLLFNVHPIKKDVNKHTDEMAVINSVKNLVLTNHYERPFQPEIGSNVSKLLFEQLDFVTAAALEREISQTIRNFEPRASVYRIRALPDYDNNGFTIDMEFTIINRTEPITITFFLERVR